MIKGDFVWKICFLVIFLDFVINVLEGVNSPPSRTFLISDFVFQDKKNIFCQCYEKYLRHLWLKPYLNQGEKNYPTFSKFIIATNRHTAVKCGFVTFNEIYLGMFWEIFRVI